jgi:hypothetical protein
LTTGASCCSDAAEFEQMSLTHPSDWKMYWKRAVGMGPALNPVIGPFYARGLAALPVDITELYPRAASLRLNWQGIYTLTNLIALRQMRSIGKSTGQNNAN